MLIGHHGLLSIRPVAWAGTKTDHRNYAALSKFNTAIDE